MPIRPLLTLCASLLAVAVVTAPTAGAALPRPGYWEAHAGAGAPLVRILIAPGSRQIAALRGLAEVKCADGHVHPFIARPLRVPVTKRGTFDYSSGPQVQLEHPGFDTYRLRGAFTSPTRMRAAVSFTSTSPGPACTAPPGRMILTAKWRSTPKLTVSPNPVLRTTNLTLTGRGFLPGLTVHLELPNSVPDPGVVVDRRYSARADANGRFSTQVRIASRLPLILGSWVADAWQLDCLEVCWVNAEAAYRVICTGSSCATD